MPAVLLSLGYLFLFLLLIRKLRFFAAEGLSVPMLSVLFLLKVLGGLALWWVYTYHYRDRSTADLYKYFDDSAVMFSALPDRPTDYVRMLFGIGNDSPYFSERYYSHMNNWFRQYEGNLYNDSHTLIRLNAFLRLFSAGQMHVHTVMAAFMSFTGLFALWKAFVPWFGERERLLAFLLFLPPSLLFWAGGPVKESLLFFAVGLLLWQVFHSIQHGLNAKGILIILSCSVLLFYLKFYVLMSMLPGLVALIWCAWRPGRTFFRFGLVLLLFLVAALNIHHLVPGFNILEVLFWKHRDFIGLADLMNSGSYVAPPALEPSVGSFVRFAPYALYITFLGPLVHLSGGAAGLLAAAETIAVLLFVVLSVLWHRPWPLIGKAQVLFCLSFVLLLALVIGYTTPVMGAIVRYRTPLLPFLLIGAALLTDPSRWPFIRNHRQ
ncbi:MAG: hypothetical protein IPL77_14645 [Flavobacteriales bacterium]|nr:hypothetical protein [Flavobacteriales bacterium]